MKRKVGETITINRPEVTGYTVCDDQPTSLEITNGSNTVKVYYKVDEGQTKDLEATVDYKLGDDVQEKDHIDLTATVQVLQPDTLSTEGVEAKSYTGWKLDSITINGEEVESLPATVNNGDAVVYNYVAATYDLIYNANEGKYPVNGTDIATVPGLDPGQYDIWTKGAEDDKIVGTMPKDEFLPTHDSVGEDKVVFVGWSERR